MGMEKFSRILMAVFAAVGGARQLTTIGGAVLADADAINRAGAMKRFYRDAHSIGHFLLRAANGALTTFQIKRNANFQLCLAGVSGQRSRL